MARSQCSVKAPWSRLGRWVCCTSSAITNREVLEQLNDLTERGLHDDEAAIPRPRSASGELGHSFVKGDGRFT